MRSMIKFELWSLFKYLVGPELVGYNSLSEKELVMSKSKLLWKEWWGYIGFQKLSLMLKLPAMTRTLGMSTPVFLRYLRANCEESE